MKLLIIGLIMGFGSLWGGSYFHKYFKKSWADEPYVITCIIIGIAGFITILVKLVQ